MAEKFNLSVSRFLTRTTRFHISELYFIIVWTPGVGKNCVWRDLVPKELLESHSSYIDQTHRQTLMEVLIDSQLKNAGR
jgi:hypothetical protein